MLWACNLLTSGEKLPWLDFQHNLQRISPATLRADIFAVGLAVALVAKT